MLYRTSYVFKYVSTLYIACPISDIRYGNEVLEMEYEVCVENCNCSSGNFYDAMESRLMQMTYWAHKQVLFEKIRQEIEKQEGAKLEKIAQLLVEASQNRWKTEKETEEKREELKEKLKETFEK